MVSNYIKTALRNLRQHKSYAGINLLGLSVAMACCILIALYVNEELSFDDFHEHADRLIAVGKEDQWGTGRITPYPLAEAMVSEMTGIEQATRVVRTNRLLLSDNQNDFVKIDQAKYVEPEFFELFSFEVLQGNPQEALAAPNNILLTPSTAKNIFGQANDVVGRSVYWQKRDSLLVLQIGGLVQEPPRNSSIQFEALVSYQTKPAWGRDISAWRAFTTFTYGLVSTGTTKDVLSEQFDQLLRAHYDIPEGEEPRRSFFGLPLKELHLSELSRSDGFTGSRAYLYLFGSIALFILGIACVNYINLATARTSIRVKEVGVRKTLGASRSQLVGQFLGESVILSLGSFLIGGIISVFALPYFNYLFGTTLSWQVDISLLIALAVASLLVGLLAGTYPALYLTRFTPASVLRGKANYGGSGSWLRKGLVVLQFAMATTLIISAIIIYQQLRYTQEKDLGFDGEKVASITLPNTSAWDNRSAIKDRLLQQPSIRKASIVRSMPGEFNVRLAYSSESVSPQAKTEAGQTFNFAPSVVDYEFLDVLNIEMVAGRYFSEELSSDRTQAFIFNEKAAEKLGWTPEEAVGKRVDLGETGEVIGVVQNFHIQSLKEEVEPVVLHLFESSSWSSEGNLLVQFSPSEIKKGMEVIRSEFGKYAPNKPIDYEFLDEKFKAMYRTEYRLGRVVILFTVLAILIAGLGLYGLSAFAAERRTKEIGIRKVLGASVANIVGLLSKDFMKLVVVGFLFAMPVAWYVMQQWLQDFAYRIDLGYSAFLLAGVIAMVIALGTVSWQAFRAATANPVNSLRSE